MRVKSFFCLTAGLAMLVSCKHKSTLAQATDRDLTIQVLQLKDSHDEDNTLGYQARLIPDKKLLENKTQEQKNALYYRMDSCFYIMNGHKKIYASLVQPIANGINGNYEYLLQFEIDKKQRVEQLYMIYNDQYINKKNYTLKVEQE